MVEGTPVDKWLHLVDTVRQKKTAGDEHTKRNNVCTRKKKKSDKPKVLSSRNIGKGKPNKKRKTRKKNSKGRAYKQQKIKLLTSFIMLAVKIIALTTVVLA